MMNIIHKLINTLLIISTFGLLINFYLIKYRIKVHDEDALELLPIIMIPTLSITIASSVILTTIKYLNLFLLFILSVNLYLLINSGIEFLIRISQVR